MIKKNLIPIVLLIVFSLSQGYTMETKKVLILPFVNNGSEDLEYLKELIPNSILAGFINLPEYTGIPLHLIIGYCFSHEYNDTDLKKIETLISISHALDADILIKGTVTDSKGTLDIYIEVFDVKKQEFRFKYHDYGKSKSKGMTTVFRIIDALFENLSEVKIEYGFLDITTSRRCELLVNKQSLGETPVNIRLPVGKHNIKLFYKDEKREGVVFDKMVVIEKDKKKTLNHDVFVDFKVDAALPCSIYVNNKFYGTTPLDDYLLIENEYLIEVIHKKNNYTVFNTYLVTEEGNNIILTLPASSSIKIESGINPFTGGISGEGFKDLPLLYSGLPVDSYQIKVFLKDEKRNIVFLDSQISTEIYNTTFIDFSTYRFQYKWGLMFLPSVSQFYNKESAKGTFVLSSFLGTSLLAGVSYLLGMYFYISGDYMDNTGYSSADICYYTAIGAGIGSGIIYLYSMIDGVLSMNHIRSLFDYE